MLNLAMNSLAGLSYRVIISYHHIISICKVGYNYILFSQEQFHKNNSLKCDRKLSVAHTAQFLSMRMKIFVAGDENLLCEGNKHQRFLLLTTIFNIQHARNSFSSLTTEDKIF